MKGFVVLSLMNMKVAIKEIDDTEDLLEKGLKLAGIVTSLFAEAGWDLVVVGGSAVEFYTEGAYMSGDIDVCRKNVEPIPMRKAQELMGQLGATGGPRSWFVAGLYLDLLGFLENESVAPLRKIETPYGTVSILPVELAIVERVLLSFYPQPDEEAKKVAKKLLAACISGQTDVDWAEVDRLAALPDFAIVDELSLLKKEVQNEL